MDRASQFGLVNTSSGSLFAVPASSWQAIRTRIRAMQEIDGQQIGPVSARSLVKRYLNGYDRADAATMRCSQETLPAMGRLHVLLDAYCTEAIRDFEAIQEVLSSLSPMAELSTGDKLRFRAYFQGLAARARDLAAAFQAIGSQLREFAAANLEVDNEARKYQDRLGSFWHYLEVNLDAVDAGSAQVLGAWSATADDLDAVASGRVEITTPFLTGLDIASALLAWGNLRDEGRAFSSTFPG